MKKIILLSIIFSLNSLLYSQSKLDIGNVVQENKITDFKSQNLILLDFWATWCGPCIPATEQLEIYQKQLKDEVYMIAISYEENYVIHNFLKRKDINIAVFQDFNKYNVKKYNVSYWPFTVVLNNKGKVLWSGSPGNLSVEKLKSFHRKTQPLDYSLSDIFNFKATAKQLKNKNSSKDTIDLFLQPISDDALTEEFNKTKDRVFFQGSIKSLVSKLYSIPELNVNSEIEKYTTVRSDTHIWENDKQRILDSLSDQTNIIIEHKTITKDAHVVSVDNKELLWDMAQINWGEDATANYIIGDDRIKADNMSINEISNLLTSLKNVNYVYQGNDKKKYDWNFHYSYNNLMKGELLDQFGLNIGPLNSLEVKSIIIKKGNSD